MKKIGSGYSDIDIESTEEKKESEEEKTKKTEEDEDGVKWRDFKISSIFAAVSAVVIYFLCVYLFFTFSNHFVNNLITFIIVLLFFALIDSLLKKTSKAGGTVILTLTICFLTNTIMQYSKGDNIPTDEREGGIPAQVINPIISITTIGVHPLDLAEGQTSDWIEVDPTFSYTFSNPKSTFYLTYEDGSIARSWEKGAWPKKYKFKVTNVAGEQFDLITK